MLDSTDSLRAKLVGEWNNHLKLYDVKFPTSDNRLYQLLCLYEFYPNPVSQEKMSQWISQKGGKNDRQARHLSWDGWYIQTGNPNSSRMEINPNLARDELCLVSLEFPNPIWHKYHQKMSEIEQNNPGFSKIIKKYKSRGCFMCGIKSDDTTPYSKITSETYQFDTIPLCKDCESWCVDRNVTLEISARLIARPIINYQKPTEQHSMTEPEVVETNRSIREKRDAYKLTDNKNEKLDLPEAETKCGHTIKVTAVKKKGGPKEGQWAIVVRGPKITGVSGKKTIYCKPSIYYVNQALSSFFVAYEIISPENGIAEILP